MMTPSPTPTAGVTPSPANVVVEITSGVPDWIQAAASIAAFLVTLALVLVTRHYAGQTKRMADEMDKERRFRERSLSREAAGRLVEALVSAQRLIERSNWDYRELYLALQSAIAINRDVVAEPSLRERVDIVNAALAEVYELQKETDKDRFGQPKPLSGPAIPRLVDAFKVVVDDLNAYRRGEPVGESRLPSRARVGDWMRADDDASVADYQ
ncbi:MAG TPA: hypothetical protein VGB83_03730 [Actinomycetota bacterium]